MFMDMAKVVLVYMHNFCYSFSFHYFPLGGKMNIFKFLERNIKKIILLNYLSYVEQNIILKLVLKINYSPVKLCRKFHERILKIETKNE